MKKLLSTGVAILSMYAMSAQDNVLTDREFWASKPSVQEVKAKIKEGNSPTELSSRNFDPIATAILADAPLEDIAYLLSLPGVDINTKTHEGRTYLIWAAVKGSVPIVKLLLDKGADVSVIDTHGISALNMGANGGIEDKDFYTSLLNKGADIKQTNNSGATALLLLMQKAKDPSLIDFFVDKGLALNATDDDGNGVFNYAAKGGNITMMDELIKRGVSYKGLNKNGENAMLLASIGARRATPELATFTYLAAKGFKSNIISNKGETPLTLVSGKVKDAKVISFFLKAGVDPNYVNKKGDNALLLAAKGGSLDMVTLLSKQTQDINHANNSGETALMQAVNGNSEEVVAYLIQQGAKVAVADNEGNSLLYYWANSGKQRNGPAKPNGAVLGLLQKNRFNVKDAQPNGNTLLHIAVQNSDTALIQKALSAGVDINAKNKEGNTALLLASLNAEDTSILKMLVDAGADKKIKSSFEESAFDLALENEILSKKHADIQFLK